MRFDSIRVRNFGILAEIDYKPEEGKSSEVVFLNGRNGRGKTSFQSAIKWCIYGIGDLEKALSLWAISEAKQGEQIEMAVELGVNLDSAGAIASIKRNQMFEKTRDGQVRRVGQEKLSVRTIGDDRLADVVPKPEVWLRKYFPERFMNFFLFDGELMKNFFDTRVKGAIENAVREIAGVDYFEEVSKKLELTKTAIDKAIAKKSGGDAERVRKNLEDARNLVLKVSQSLQSNSQKLSDLEQELKDCEARWAGVKDAAEDAERNIEINRLLTEKGRTLSRLNLEFNDLALRAGSMAFLSGAVNILEDAILHAREEGTLPPPFNPAALEHLLAREECICGGDLSEGSKGCSEILDLIKNFEKASLVGNKLDSSGRGLEVAGARLSGDFATLKAKNETIIGLRQDIEELRAEQDTLTASLGELPETSLAVLSARIRELNGILPNMRLDLAEEERDLKDRLIPAERKAQEAFDDVSANADEVNQLAAESRLAGELSQAAGAIHAIAIQLVRERLEESISKKFAIVKSGSFTTRVTEDFEVLTLEPDGTEAILSEGEKMMKAYIFSIALREVIGLAFPLVVDTPFGRLDEYHREELAELLADLVSSDSANGNRQVIFLMHDGEYTPYTKKHFEKTKPVEAYLTWEEKEKKSMLGYGIASEWFATSAWKDWKAGKIN